MALAATRNRCFSSFILWQRLTAVPSPPVIYPLPPPTPPSLSSPTLKAPLLLNLAPSPPHLTSATQLSPSPHLGPQPQESAHLLFEGGLWFPPLPSPLPLPYTLAPTPPHFPPGPPPLPLPFPHPNPFSHLGAHPQEGAPLLLNLATTSLPHTHLHPPTPPAPHLGPHP